MATSLQVHMLGFVSVHYILSSSIQVISSILKEEKKYM